MKIYFGSDHSGFKLKHELLEYVKTLEHEVYDKGPFAYNEGDDFPDFIIPVAQEVSRSSDTVKGIIIGASGEGEVMCANRFKGVRAALYYGPASRKQTDASGKELDIIASTREHNNANILSLGARFITEEEAKATVKLFLETPFSNDERHVRRLAKIEKLASCF